jgi:Protein of unknown function (DUF2795)
VTDVDRGSSKHSARLDEELGREVRTQLGESPEIGRDQEWRQVEPSADGDPDVSRVPHPDTNPGTRMGPDDVAGRNRLGRYLHRSVFPADRTTLIATARTLRAPDVVLAELARLPADERFDTVARVWQALGHPLDERF